MKSIKCLILMMICLISASFITKASAQVYSDGALFYTSQEFPLTDHSTVYVCIFDGDKAYVYNGVKSTISKYLSKSSSYFDDKGRGTKFTFSQFKIDDDITSSYRTVYSDDYRFEKKHVNSRTFYAVSEDQSTVIRFEMDREKTRVLDGVYTKKIYLIRIDKEDLLPKSMNPNELDFLNE